MSPICIYICYFYKGIPQKLLWFAIIVYAIAATIQYFLPGAFAFLLNRSNSTIAGLGGRGVSSLTAEPTFYGTFCLIFLILLYWENRLNRKNKYFSFFVWIILFQIVFLSRSAMIVFYLILGIIPAIFIYCLCQKKYFVLAVGIISFTLIYYLIHFILYDTIYEYGINSTFRAVKVLCQILISPLDLLFYDESVNQRFFHNYIPFYVFCRYYGTPCGFSETSFFYFTQYLSSNDYFVTYILNNSPAGGIRFMSCLGGFFPQLGFLAIFLSYSLIKPFLRNLKSIWDCYFFSLYIFILFSAVSFNTVLILMPFAHQIYLNHKENNETFVTN